MFVFAAMLPCSILPGQVAFTSLISVGGLPRIALLRLTSHDDPARFQNFPFLHRTLRKADVPPHCAVQRACPCGAMVSLPVSIFGAGLRFDAHADDGIP
jgi:hypothetical protein